ncbi:putative seizure protein 6-like protein [Triplophysa rosa]|uniref:Seizure protein 6-like protein n=1 Tax=Triplophysa rosa TaxID=992332 RepID=A0A9W7TNH2_TRIRA|nr:putative seizure protein 6-like protein [Triplophysa rosa]
MASVFSVLFKNVSLHSASVTQRGGQPEGEDGSYHTTQDPKRELPLFTTAPPFSSLDHHPPFKPFLPYDPRPQNHEEYFHDSGGASHHPTMPSSRSHHLRDASTQSVPHEDAPPFSDVAASRPTTSAPSSAAVTQPYMSNVRHEPLAETQRRVSEDPHVTMTIGSLTTTYARTSAAPSSSSDKHLDAGVTVSSNVRARDASFHVKTSKEKLTQIKGEHDAIGSDVTGTASSLSVDLDDETTTSTIITTTVITNMQMPAFVLSCNFPDRPAYGDVSVTSLHAGGEAYFYCFNGYQIQGPSTLTCRNATTPYWNGKVPSCLVSCGGMLKNATLGRIMSPGFPGNYSNNLTCHWVLQAPEDQRLHVHFEKVALAEDDDRFLIKDGNHIDSTILYDSYEVEYLPNEGIVGSSRHLFVEFSTDGFGTNTGVAIRYEAFAAGHCYEPFVKYGNFTTTDSAYALGVVVEFTCDPGYTLEQGSVIIECMDPGNPQWNETEPACRAVCSGEITDSAGVVLSPNWPEAYDKGQDCIWGIHVEEDKRIMLDIQVLHLGKNDMLTFYDGDDLTAKVLGQYGGSRPRFKLYTSMADVTIQFQSDPATNIYGYNNGFVVHFFEVPRNDTCPELPEISNGWKTTSHPDLVHGTVVTYQCYPGFELVGTEMLMCQWDLTWSGDLPSCERVLSCPDPGTVEHSRRVMSGPRLIVGSTVQFICNKGYSLSGNSLLSCYHRDSTGPKWSEKLPKCMSDSYEPCRNPGTPAYSIQSSEKHMYQAGETVRFSCLNGYQLQGEPVLRCVPGHPSKWSHPPPLCKALPFLPAGRLEYIDERRLDAASADFSIEGASVAVSIFIPVAIILIIIMSIYFYFSRVQGKSLRLSLTASPQYDHIRGESAFENPTYDTANNEDTREYEVSI